MVWDSAQFADIGSILQTVDDKEMLELAVMAKKSDPPPLFTRVVKEKRNVPTLETITSLMTTQYPDQNVPNATMCEQIGYIFLKLSEANKAYGEAAEALAELSTKVSPEHYMLLLMAATNSDYTNYCTTKNDITRSGTSTAFARGNNGTGTHCHH